MLENSRKLSHGRLLAVSVAFGSLLGVAACSEQPITPPPTFVLDPPVLVSATPKSPPENVLSARIALTARQGSVMRLAYWADGDTVMRTEYRTMTADADTVVLLGLKPAKSYKSVVEMAYVGMQRTSDTVTFQTQALPPAIAALSLTTTAGSATRMSLTSSYYGGNFAVAFDRTGAVVWYHDFTALGPTQNIMQQPNGNYTAFIGNTAGWQPNDGYYVEVTPEGLQVAEYHPPAGYYMDNHEILITGTGAAKRAHFFTFSIRETDFSGWGGRPAVQLAGHQLVRMDGQGHVEFTWDAWEHIALSEWVGDQTQKQTWIEVDFDHPNALTFDREGNYVVSWRNLNQVMAIHAQTGEILWRFGGVKSDFTFASDPFGGFSKQHAVKILSNGNLLLYDNGTEHAPSQSRAAEYRLDRLAGTATLVWEYRNSPSLFTPYVGWVERLENANTWVAFSLMGRVMEVAPNGSVLWDGQLRVNGTPTGQYRILALASLH